MMMSKKRQIVDSLTSTARINPDDYSVKTSPNRVQSLGYALAGWLYMLRWQKNVRILIPASILAVSVALWLGVSFVGLATIIIVITIVWMAEFLNAAVEAVVNLATEEWHPMAKVAKDVAAAAVLLGVVAAVLVGLLVLGPPLLQRLGLAS
jgi:diacylglycerol kinase (ATP)